jgi:hypothetical protein
VSAAVAFFLLAYPGGDFGQREQIAVLFVLPYVLTSCLAVSGRSPGLRTSLISGVLGGIGFAIKPHFLLAFVLAELVVLAHRLAASGRWLRPSAAAAALTMLVYAVVVIVFVPQFLEVARHVVRVYGGLDAEPHVILALVDLRVWAAAAFAFAALHRWLPHRPVSLLLLAVATGFLGAAVVQMKGWPYHLYPWRFFIAVFAASVSVSVLERLTHSGRLPARTVPILAAAASLVLVVAAQRAAPRTTRPSGIEQVVALDEIIRTARAESVAVLSMRTILFPAFPAVNYSGARWVMRHHSMWFLPGLYADQMEGEVGEIPGRATGQMDPLESRFFDAIVSDLCAEPPRLLVIEPPLPKTAGNPPSIDLLAYYRQDPAFARMTDAYRFHSRFGPFDAYLRRGDASCGTR